MAGFMDYFTGAGTDFFGGNASGMNDLLTAQQQEAIKRQSMLAMAAQLLQAGGRSPQRTSLGQALGQGLMAGQQAQQAGTTGAVNQMLLRQKLEEAKRAQALQSQIADVFAGGQPTQQDATVAQAPTAQVNPRAVQADRYRQAAALSANDPTKAKAYMDIAEMLNPREKVTGQPFEVTDATGKPVMVQQMEDGTLRTMQGFGPKRDVVLQNLGGRTVAVDKSKMTGGESFEQTMTPAEAANLGISQANLGIARAGLGLRQAEFARGAFDRVETPEGFVNIPKAGGPAVPVMGPGGQQLKGVGAQPTEGQANAAGFAQRMERAGTILPALEATGSFPGAGSAAAGAVPFVGGAMRRGVQSADVQRYEQAAQDWIRAKLRKESGAAIGKDEMAQEYATYFPMVGDSPQVIAQKAEARAVATEAMKTAAGRSYKPYVAPARPGSLHPTDIQNIIDTFNRGR